MKLMAESPQKASMKILGKEDRLRRRKRESRTRKRTRTDTVEATVGVLWKGNNNENKRDPEIITFRRQLDKILIRLPMVLLHTATLTAAHSALPPITAALPHTAALPPTHCRTAAPYQAHCRTLPRVLPHAPAHCHAHCRTQRTAIHCRTAAHCRTVTHALSHCRTLPSALPHTATRTAA